MGSSPTPRGGGVQAHTSEVQAQAQGRSVSQYALRQTPPSKQTATAAGSTHPTGMHSYCNNNYTVFTKKNEIFTE